MNLVLDAQVVVGATAAVTGLAAGFFLGWCSRGRAESSLRAELVRVEALVAHAPKQTAAEEQEQLDSAKTIVIPRRPRPEPASTRTMSLAQVHEHAQRARYEG